MKMTVHEGLSRLKTLDSRIEKASNERFVSAMRVSDKFVAGETVENVTKRITASKDSVFQLITNFTRLKNAILESNSVTKIEVNGLEMTVAEAIAAKEVIKMKKELSENLKYHYNYAKKTVENEMRGFETAKNNYLEKVKKEDSDVKTLELLEQNYINKNTWVLLDPLNAAALVDTIDKEVEDFETNIDFRLSESNATTLIDIDWDM